MLRAIPIILSTAAPCVPREHRSQDILNPRRLMKPKVRRPGSDHWEDISWDHAIQQIARHIKPTRDCTFVAKNAKGQLVNRPPRMAMIGVSTDTKDINLLLRKSITALVIPYEKSE